MKKYLYLIGVAIFIYIIWRLNIKEIFKVLSQTNLLYFFLAFLLVLASFLIKIYRWNYLKKIQGMPYKFKNSFIMNMSSYSIGIITPGQIGEMSKFMFLKKDGHPTVKALVNIALDKFFDLFLLVLFGFLGLIFFFNFLQQFIWFFVLVLIIIIAIIASFKMNWVKKLITKIICILISKKHKASLQLVPQKISEEINSIKIKNYMFIMLITGISWIFFFAQAYILIRAVGINNVSFIYISLAATIARFVSLLPISILGLGTREGILILLLSPCNVSAESIVSFSLLITLIMLIIALISLIFWFKKPVPIK